MLYRTITLLMLCLGTMSCGDLALVAMRKGEFARAESYMDSGDLDYSERKEVYAKYCNEQGMLASSQDSGGMNNLGLCYEQGLGDFSPDLKQAIYWYEQSARLGNAQAQSNLVRLDKTPPTVDVAAVSALSAARVAAEAQEKAATAAQWNQTNAILSNMLLQRQIQQQQQRGVSCSSNILGSTVYTNCR